MLLYVNSHIVMLWSYVVMHQALQQVPESSSTPSVVRLSRYAVAATVVLAGPILCTALPAVWLFGCLAVVDCRGKCSNSRTLPAHTTGLALGPTTVPTHRGLVCWPGSGTYYHASCIVVVVVCLPVQLLHLA